MATRSIRRSCVCSRLFVNVSRARARIRTHQGRAARANSSWSSLKNPRFPPRRVQLSLNLMKIHLQRRTLKVHDDREPRLQPRQRQPECLACQPLQPIALHGATNLPRNCDSEPRRCRLSFPTLNKNVQPTTAKGLPALVSLEEIGPLQHAVFLAEKVSRRGRHEMLHAWVQVSARSANLKLSVSCGPWPDGAPAQPARSTMTSARETPACCG